MDSADILISPGDRGPAGKERRTAPRRPFSREVILQPLASEEQHCLWAEVQDVSHGGIGLLLSHWLPPGTDLVIAVPSRKPEETRVLAGRVVHADRQPHGNTYLGCAFQGGRNESVLAALGVPDHP